MVFMLHYECSGIQPLDGQWSRFFIGYHPRVSTLCLPACDQISQAFLLRTHILQVNKDGGGNGLGRRLSSSCDLHRIYNLSVLVIDVSLNINRSNQYLIRQHTFVLTYHRTLTFFPILLLRTHFGP